MRLEAAEFERGHLQNHGAGGRDQCGKRRIIDTDQLRIHESAGARRERVRKTIGAL
jgi:hypothetical protein